jgi:hypothetical protein
LFGHVVGPDSWKRVLYRPLETLFRAPRQGDDMVFETLTEPAPAMALLGVRACEFAAIAIRDRSEPFHISPRIVRRQQSRVGYPRILAASNSRDIKAQAAFIAGLFDAAA